jgi:pimeloyl-ACP methyl ester carboxylesterase
MTAPALRKILVAAGVPAADAEETARHVDATMKRCILALYHSAVHVGREWSDDLRRITVPGLVPWGELDPYAASRFGPRLAERTNARLVSWPGCSHWWQLERPDAVADELQRFWKEVRDG